MPKIQQLSPHVADLIAAGEVVERPASAAKELVENAIDAGAHKVTVELRDGGMTFLRVTDDGCGMAAEDVETAFLRHATSKLHEAADLEAIHTLGFRGEALAAISSVSRIDVLTKTADAPFGTSLHLEAGVVTERGEAGCPNGTTMLVRDLFYEYTCAHEVHEARLRGGLRRAQHGAAPCAGSSGGRRARAARRAGAALHARRRKAPQRDLCRHGPPDRAGDDPRWTGAGTSSPSRAL